MTCFPNPISKLLGAGLTVAVCTGAFFLVARSLGPIPVYMNQITTNKYGTFDVTGTSSVTTTPDKASFSVGVSFNESTAKSAQEKADKAIASITKEYLDMGIEKKDIKTINYSLYPNYDYSNGSRATNGYSVNATLQVSVTDFALLNTAIDKATAIGANQINAVQFSLSDTKRKEVEKEARELAVADAKDRAESLAGTAGIRLGKVMNIIETNLSFPRPMYEIAKVMTASEDSSVQTQVEPGTTTVNMSIMLSYETK